MRRDRRGRGRSARDPGPRRGAAGACHAYRACRGRSLRATGPSRPGPLPPRRRRAVPCPSRASPTPRGSPRTSAAARTSRCSRPARHSTSTPHSMAPCGPCPSASLSASWIAGRSRRSAPKSPCASTTRCCWPGSGSCWQRPHPPEKRPAAASLRRHRRQPRQSRPTWHQDPGALHSQATPRFPRRCRSPSRLLHSSTRRRRRAPSWQLRSHLPRDALVLLQQECTGLHPAQRTGRHLRPRGFPELPPRRSQRGAPAPLLPWAGRAATPPAPRRRPGRIQRREPSPLPRTLPDTLPPREPRRRRTLRWPRR
mmetsp:Transcript_23399/g.73392  ORF Transcript_23399/g.73392 Transcript_23399/m.73392 type:complete len:311 (-) Transcript_23399:1229-2161(-)